MLTRLPRATIRTQVELPLRFADGFTTEARVFSFDGLVDGGEHLAFALGACASPHRADDRHVPLIRPHSECLTGDVFASSACDCNATIDQSLALSFPSNPDISPDGSTVVYQVARPNWQEQPPRETLTGVQWR